MALITISAQAELVADKFIRAALGLADQNYRSVELVTASLDCRIFQTTSFFRSLLKLTYSELPRSLGCLPQLTCTEPNVRLKIRLIEPVFPQSQSAASVVTQYRTREVRI